jgi:hypothetical protein
MLSGRVEARRIYSKSFQEMAKAVLEESSIKMGFDNKRNPTG